MSAPMEYELSNGWGDALHFFDPKELHEEFDEKTKRFQVYGHKRRIPHVDDTLKADFGHTVILFKFVEVNPCGNPPDMFFAWVMFDQLLKAPTPPASRTSAQGDGK